jgi:hypothetical protein
MEYLLLILTVLGVIIGILYLYSSQYDYDVYKYKCHHCKYQNVTLKSYDY